MKQINIPKNEYINLIIRIVVGFVFVIFGASKIAEPALFAKDISNYDMLWHNFINLSAIILPWIEIISGLFLMFGIRLKANILLIAAMLLVFNAAVAVAWARGLDINCGCYSNVAEQKVGMEKLAENFAMIFALAFIFFFPNNKISLEKLIADNN
jgi:uncharacterized membrane protein YphA (DoxX/SURF4 family)